MLCCNSTADKHSEVQFLWSFYIQIQVIVIFPGTRTQRSSLATWIPGSCLVSIWIASFCTWKCISYHSVNYQDVKCLCHVTVRDTTVPEQSCYITSTLPQSSPVLYIPTPRLIIVCVPPSGWGTGSLSLATQVSLMRVIPTLALRFKVMTVILFNDGLSKDIQYYECYHLHLWLQVTSLDT